MTMQNHLAALEKRRESLKKEIEVCEQHPSVDELKIASLKRQKLLLKDEIVRLRAEGSRPEVPLKTA
jgi:hypothetical protein